MANPSNSHLELVDTVLGELRRPPSAPSPSLRRLLAVLDPMIRDRLLASEELRRDLDRARLLGIYQRLLLELFSPGTPALAAWDPAAQPLPAFIAAFVDAFVAGGALDDDKDRGRPRRERPPVSFAAPTTSLEK